MKIYINELYFGKLLSDLILKIDSKRINYDFVVGIKNGGLNISSYISYVLNKPHHAIRISFYDNDKKLETPTVEGLDEFKKTIYTPNCKFLLIDDIVDSGSTIRYFIKDTGLVKGKDFYVASLHWCPCNSPDLRPEFYSETKNSTDWVIYHWEKE